MVYLMYPGTCQAAMTMYAKAFQTKLIELVQYKDSGNPDFHYEAGRENWVLRSILNINGMVVMAVDSPVRTSTGDNTSLHYMPNTVEEAKHAWSVLSPGASKVFIKPSRTLFAEYHCCFKDQFGINWMFTVHHDFTKWWSTFFKTVDAVHTRVALGDLYNKKHGASLKKGVPCFLFTFISFLFSCGDCDAVADGEDAAV